MIRGRVTGRVWSSRRVDTLPNGALLEVTLDGGRSIIALDPLGCKAVCMLQRKKTKSSSRWAIQSPCS